MQPISLKTLVLLRVVFLGKGRLLWVSQDGDEKRRMCLFPGMHCWEDFRRDFFFVDFGWLKVWPDPALRYCWADFEKWMVSLLLACTVGRTLDGKDVASSSVFVGTHCWADFAENVAGSLVSVLWGGLCEDDGAFLTGMHCWTDFGCQPSYKKNAFR